MTYETFDPMGHDSIVNGLYYDGICRAPVPGAPFNLFQEEKSDESATDFVLVVTERVCASR